MSPTISLEAAKLGSTDVVFVGRLLYFFFTLVLSWVRQRRTYERINVVPMLSVHLWTRNKWKDVQICTNLGHFSLVSRPNLGYFLCLYPRLKVSRQESLGRIIGSWPRGFLRRLECGSIPLLPAFSFLFEKEKGRRERSTSRRETTPDWPTGRQTTCCFHPSRKRHSVLGPDEYRPVHNVLPEGLQTVTELTISPCEI